MIEFILGGVRSGKSRLAQTLALESGLPVTYVATAFAGDEEMADRIQAHRAQRPADWTCVEEPFFLAAALREHAARERCIIVDCLTLWLTQLLTLRESAWATEHEAFISCLPQLPGRIILVSNETNTGVIPIDPLTRRFCDAAGVMHQAVAAYSTRVLLVTAGLPITLKGERR